MKYLKRFNEEINFSNILGKTKMADAKTFDAPETSLYFTIDRDYYEKNDIGQSKYKVYLTKDGVTYYIGDIRKFDNGECISYINLNKMSKVSFPKNVRGLKDEEMQIIDEEMDKEDYSNNLMDEPVTYRQKIENL